MITVTGTIEDITCCTNPEKVTVTLIPDKYERAYIDFKGRRAAEAVAFKKNDSVTVVLKFDGRKSKVGVTYNNLEGRSIRHVENSKFLDIQQ